MELRRAPVQKRRPGGRGAALGARRSRERARGDGGGGGGGDEGQGISTDLVFSESELMAMIHGEGRAASEFTMRRRWRWVDGNHLCVAPPLIVRCGGQG